VAFNRESLSKPNQQPKGINTMTNQQIRDYYDSKLNMSIIELALITGKSVKALKKILMGDK
jgi:hypothetical protein